MLRRCLAAFCVAVLTGWAVPVRAHGIVGKRLFIEPLFTEDANPKTELDFPVFEAIHSPDGHISIFNSSVEYKIAPRFSVGFDSSYNWLTLNGGAEVSGFDNFGFGLKYALYRNQEHEFIVSPGLHVEAPTGAGSIGAAPYATITPELLYAKGFGDLPHTGFARWLRPFAVQGDFTLNLPAGGRQTPDRAKIPHADLVLEYSLPYLNAYVRHANAGYSLGDGDFRKGHSAGAIAGDLFPFVELNFEAAPYGSGRRALGFYRPGVDYIGHYFQIGVAADLPASTFSGNHAGVVAIFDIFLDEALPKLKPLFH